MDTLTRDKLIELCERQDQPCVSLYLPTHRSIPETEQDPLRLKNLLDEATTTLEQQGADVRLIRRMTDPARHLLDDRSFWNHQSDGLAIFLADGVDEMLRLPRRFDEQVWVDDHFFVNPLLPLVQHNGKFYIVAVSQNSCRLFVANRDAIQQVDDPNLPGDLQSALGWNWERQQNLHSMQQRPQSRAGDDTAIYHGHDQDQKQVELPAYLRHVDAALMDILRMERAPLIFAGVGSLFPVYREVNNYPALCEQPVEGNPDDVSIEELHQQAWPIARQVFEAQAADVLSHYERKASHPTTTLDLSVALAAARNGLVETLIIKDGDQQWGRFDDKTGKVTLRHASGPRDDDEDLLGLAAVWTLRTSGDVVALDAERMPNGAPLIALLRAPAESVAT